MDTQRRCTSLRRTLRHCLASAIPTYLEACHNLQPLIDEDVFDQYSILYDITASDLERTSLGYPEQEMDNLEALKGLRALHQRATTSRRILLAELLSLPADGDKADFSRWRRAIDEMDQVTSVTAGFTQKLATAVTDEESMYQPVYSKSGC